MSIVSRKQVLGRVTRKVMANVTVGTANTLERFMGIPLNQVITKICATCDEEKHPNEYYVKPYRQNVPADELTLLDLREDCIKCFDQKVEEGRALRED